MSAGARNGAALRIEFTFKVVQNFASRLNLKKNNTMNKQDKKHIEGLMEKFERIGQDIADLRSEIQSQKDAQEEKLENTPENLQGGEAYQLREEDIQSLEEADDYGQEAEDALSSLCGSLSDILDR